MVELLTVISATSVARTHIAPTSSPAHRKQDKSIADIVTSSMPMSVLIFNIIQNKV